MTVVHIAAVTRNKSIAGTTLHTMMNMHMQCMVRGHHVEIHFVTDKSSLPKMIKTGERIMWLDYGTNIDEASIIKAIEPFDKGVQILVFPAVKEGIDWDRFVKRTREGSTEPVHQRGLVFDTEVGKKLIDDIYDVTKTSARVWAMDAKPVDKKLRQGKVPINLPLSDDGEMFKTLINNGIKVGAFTTSDVVCHYVHECFGNILEMGGIKLNA
jgi:hypothetical protein